MKLKAMALVLVSFISASAFAADVCEIVVVKQRRTAGVDNYYGASCTDEKESIHPNAGTKEIESRKSVIKKLIDRGYELKTENILVKDSSFERTMD